MKFLEFHSRIKQSNENLSMSQQNHENHENLIILRQNQDNHEIHIIIY